MGEGERCAMDDTQERMQILDMIDSGKISAAEGLRLLQALSGEVSAPQDEALPAGEAGASVVPTAWEPPQGENEPPPAESPGAASERVEAQVLETSGPAQPRSLPAEARKWRRWWMIPF